MRMDPSATLSADNVVNHWPQQDLARVIYEYGEERFARRVAREIVSARPIADTVRLAEVVSRAVRTSGGIHPATRTFQAIRIAVNGELASLEEVLPQALSVLAPGGVMVVISFPFARRPHCQAVHAARVARVHLSAASSRLRLRSRRANGETDAQADPGRLDRDRAESEESERPAARGTQARCG